jgi:hypothetical protein
VFSLEVSGNLLKQTKQKGLGEKPSDRGRNRKFLMAFGWLINFYQAKKYSS